MSNFKYIEIRTLAEYPDIQIVSLNRPEVKNAFHPEMISEITQAFQQIKDKRCVILKGEGTAFCAGADLGWMKEMVNYSMQENISDSEKLWQMFEAIASCPAIVIGIAHGAVYGGALGLLATCDIAFAEEATKFCFSEVRLGLSPAVISSFVFRKIEDSKIRPYMLTAEIFNIEKAIQLGLVHKKYLDQLDLQEVIRLVSGNGVQAMSETKKLLNSLSENPTWSEQKKLTTKVISERRMGPEAQDRLKKFLLKN